MIGARLHLGLPTALRPAAADLYWQAFGPKLGRVLGPPDLARNFLLRVMRADQVISAIGPEGTLLGIAGFRTSEGGFASGNAADLKAVYGHHGALWRSTLLDLLSREEDGSGFLLDGICVTGAARGQGLGSALIEAICAEARQRGFDRVRLDVVQGNLRAIALYQRLGFRVTARHPIGLLSLAFRFQAALTMQRDLDDKVRPLS